MSKPTEKAVYRIRNWRQYNDALVRRGSLTAWVDQGSLDAWNYHGPAQWGGQYVYGDAAIQCLLTLRAAFHLPLRATQGLGRSLFELMGLALAVPHYRTLSRRAADLKVDPSRESKGPLHLVLDSTGLKVDGEGEGKVRKRGYSKRRTWRKLPLAIDADSHEIQAVMVTEAGVDDAEGVDHLLKGIDRPVASAAARTGRTTSGRYTGCWSPARAASSSRRGVTPGSGSTATPPGRPCPVMRTCVTSDGWAGRRGSGRSVITSGRWPRRVSSG